MVSDPLSPITMEPAPRIELGTDGLRNRCSTAELRWHLAIKLYLKPILKSIVADKIADKLHKF